MNSNLSSVIVQFIIAIIMLAVAFEVKWIDLKTLPRHWKKLLLGFGMQVVFLPTFIFFILFFFRPETNLVMAFLLLASCPGGNLSQLFVVRSQGHVGLSMGMTFLSTFLSPITVPGIFFMATHAQDEWVLAYKVLELEWISMFQTMLFSLFIPLLLGMWIANKNSTGWIKLKKIIQRCVPWLLSILLLGAVWSFRSSFHQVSLKLMLAVAFLSATCLVVSYLLASFIGQDYKTSITLAWEVSTQNSGLGMVLGLIYFSQIPEVTLVCAFWGIWQICMGLAVSGLFQKQLMKKEVKCQIENAG